MSAEARPLDQQISKDEYRELEQIGDPEPRHYRHPTDPTLTWCGKKERKGGGTYRGISIIPVEKITCVDCLHLYINKGNAWWWRVHKLWYGTNCQNGLHDCS